MHRYILVVAARSKGTLPDYLIEKTFGEPFKVTVKEWVANGPKPFHSHMARIIDSENELFVTKEFRSELKANGIRSALIPWMGSSEETLASRGLCMWEAPPDPHEVNINVVAIADEIESERVVQEEIQEG